MQAWSRYTYVNNAPTNFDDPTGHCLILCTAAIGAVVSLAADYFVTTQINHEEYSLQRGLVAVGTGALAGAVGAGIIAPLAQGLGAAVGSIAGSLSAVPYSAVPAISLGAELTAGAVMGAEANILINSAQCNVNAALEGVDVTRQSISADMQSNIVYDGLFGAAGYGLGSALGKGISWMCPANLQSNNAQKAIIGGMQAAAQAVSDPAFIDAAEDAGKDFVNGR